MVCVCTCVRVCARARACLHACVCFFSHALQTLESHNSILLNPDHYNIKAPIKSLERVVHLAKDLHFHLNSYVNKAIPTERSDSQPASVLLLHYFYLQIAKYNFIYTPNIN